MRGGSASLAIVAGVWLAAATAARAQLITITVGGGGSSRTDCLLVLRASANDPPDKPKKVTCTDGDPTCDNDGAVNGVCEFVVGACANSTFDPTHCTLAGVESVAVQHAQDNGDPKFDTEFQALQARIDGLELPVLPDTLDKCTTTTKVHVVVGGPFPGNVCKRAKKQIKIVTQSTFQLGKSYKDTDKLQLTCNPAPGPCDPHVLFGGTFDRIQRQIFNQNCALSHCHDSQTHAGDQILDNATTSYSQIVNHVPNNTAAAALGWLRIDAANASPDTSFMYHKLTGDLPDKTAFGERMPRGRPKLDQFLIDILKLWIEAGAPDNPTWVLGTY
jgi:hypothetical protein